MPATKFVSRGLVRGTVVGRVIPRAGAEQGSGPVATLQREVASAFATGSAGHSHGHTHTHHSHASETVALHNGTDGALALKSDGLLALSDVSHGKTATKARGLYSVGEAVLEARLRGYEGESCRECGNFTLVRNGTCLKCDTCGGTSGCS